MVNILDHKDPNKVEFIEYIHKKTLGNPLGIKRFLKTLEIMNLISFDGKILKWVWQTKVLKTVLDFSDYNLLIAHSIGDDSDSLINMLKYGACIGNEIPLSILKPLTDEFIDDLIFFIHQAIKIGILSKQSKVGDNEHVYQFNHDSIREYFYKSIEPDIKNNIHLRIGRIITEKGIDNSTENLLLVIDQYNRALDIIKSAEEKLYVSSLNLRAGKLLLRSLAYRSSLKYFTSGLSILSKDEGSGFTEILIELYRFGAEAAYLCYDSDMLDSISNEIKNVTNDPVLRTYIVSLQIRLKFSKLQFDETIELGFQALSDFNVAIDLNKNLSDIFEDYNSLKLRLLEIGLNKIDKISDINNTAIIAKIHLLESLLEVLYTYKPELYPVFVFKILEITLDFGNHKFLGNCLANMALLAGGLFNDIDFANELCLAGIKTWKTSRDKFIIFFGSYTWKHHYRSSLSPLKELIDSYVETGEFSYSGFAAFQYSYVMLQIGYNLKFISDMTSEFQNVFIKTKDTYNLSMNSILLENLHALRGQKNNFNQLEDQLVNIGNNNLLCHFYNLKLFLMYIHGDFENIIGVGQQALKYSLAVIGSVEFIAIYYFFALAILRTQRELKIHDEEINLVINEIFTKFEVWAQIYPVNFGHKFVLMQAETRNTNSEFKAIAILYEKAIALSKKNKYNLDEAISYELAGRFYFDEKFDDIGKTYVHKALTIYRQIGATEKMKLLEEEFELSQLIEPNETYDLDTYKEGSYSNLDFTSLVNTLLTLSSETDYDELIRSMMNIIVEQSAAEICLLFINTENEDLHKDGWQFQAQFNKISKEIEIYKDDNFVNPTGKGPLPEQLPTSIFNYGVRTGETLLVHDSLRDERFFDDPYLLENQIKTFIALPLKSQDRVKGFLFLGNSKMEGAFTYSQLEFVRVLSFQFLISIENTNLYKQLRQKIKSSDEKLILARKLADEELTKLSILKDLETSKTSSPTQTKSTEHIDRFIDYMNYLSKILEPSELEEMGIK